MMRCCRSALSTSLAVGVLAGCSGTAGGPPAPTSPAERTAPAPTAVPGPPAPTAGTTLTTSCERGVWHAAPEPGGMEVSDTVVLQGTGPAAELGGSTEPGLPHFLKVPVSVRGYAEVVVSVASGQPGGVAISWASSPDPPGVEVSFEPCDSGRGHEWSTYSGGFYVDAPRCATVVVEVDGRTTRQQVPLGAPCPGARKATDDDAPTWVRDRDPVLVEVVAECWYDASSASQVTPSRFAVESGWPSVAPAMRRSGVAPPAGRWACVLVLPALVAAASGIASSVARGAPEQAGFGWVWPLPVIGVLLGTARLIPALRAAPPPE